MPATFNTSLTACRHIGAYEVPIANNAYQLDAGFVPVRKLGKLPAVVKDSPGFLVNRVLMPYLIEAGHLFENGARVEDIDEAMLEFGMPMGPLRLTDEVGVDVANHVAETIAKNFSPRLTTPAILEKMMKAGLLGKKSGRGFYDYDRGEQPPRA